MASNQKSTDKADNSADILSKKSKGPEDASSEELEEAEQDATDPTHEKEVSPE
jgi:hypothetical protein